MRSTLLLAGLLPLLVLGGTMAACDGDDEGVAGTSGGVGTCACLAGEPCIGPDLCSEVNGGATVICHGG
jgi:hypothetical protein